MATVTEKLTALNAADLSTLRAKLDQLKAEIAAALNAENQKADSVATTKDVAAAAQTAGVSAEEFLAALEWAKKIGLI
jgi:hypothetical protein